MTLLLFRPPRPAARPVPGGRRPIAYAMDTGPNGPIAELREDLTPSNGQDFALVFDEDDPGAGPPVTMRLETFTQLTGGRTP